MYGMGRAAYGNCTLELLLGFLKNPKFDIRPVLDLIAADYIPLRAKHEWGYIIPHADRGATQPASARRSASARATRPKTTGPSTRRWSRRAWTRLDLEARSADRAFSFPEVWSSMATEFVKDLKNARLVGILRGCPDGSWTRWPTPSSARA